MIRLRIIFSFLLLQTCITPFAQQRDSLLPINHFGNNPGNLKMFVYANNIKKDTGLKPLVIVLHGCGQTAGEVANLTGWNKLGYLNDFVVVYPQQRVLNNMSTCFNWFRNADINKGQGECESIYQMLRYMLQHYAIDSNRVFITGLSAGAAMAVVMMATHPESFKGGAIFAGGAYKLATSAFEAAGVMAGTKKLSKEELIKNVTEQNPAYKGPYPGLIIYQGLNDLVVNHKNAGLLIDQWTGINGIDNMPDKTETSYAGVADIKRTEYADNSGSTIVTFYEIADLGHKILVKPGDKNDEGGETGTYGTDRGFHATFQTARDFGIIK